MRTLVTGATGFVGGRLADALAERGAGEGVSTAYYLVHSMGRGTEREGSASASAAPPPADDQADSDPFGLTPRERDVLTLVAAGATNREIGEQLHMAEKTASVHVSRILAKLNVRSRTEAAAVAHRQGLVPTA